MELANFKFYIDKVITEGNRLQRYDINGKLLSGKWYTNSNNLSFFMSIISIIFLQKGFSNDFSGYVISFLGIFIGLFTSIIISMYDKSNNLMANYETLIDTEKARILQIKNYLVQFTGLTSYSILLALFIIILLLISLMSDFIQTDLGSLVVIKGYRELNLVSFFYFLEFILLITHRFLIVYLLMKFFVITIFSVTSYFTFLLSEYNKLKVNQ